MSRKPEWDSITIDGKGDPLFLRGSVLRNGKQIPGLVSMKLEGDMHSTWMLTTVQHVNVDGIETMVPKEEPDAK